VSYDGPAFLAPEFLPDALATASALTRPVLARGGAPGAVALLAEVEARGLVSALLAPTPLVAPGQVAADVVVTRAMSPAGGVTIETAVDGSLVAIGATGAAFGAPPWRLQVRVPGTNRVRNPRGEGLIPGSPGTLPTHWTLAVGTGLTREVVGAATLAGIQGSIIRVHGVPASSSGQAIFVEAANQIAAASGQTWTVSAFLALVGGSVAGLNVLRWNLPGTNGASGTETTVSSIISAITGAPQRFSVTRLLNNGATTHLRAGVEYQYTSGVPIDFSIFIGAPQGEQAGAASQPILPAAGSPAAQTRGADLPTWTPGGFPPRGAILLSGVLGSVSGADPWGLAQLDAGADTNRIVARTVAGSGLVEALVVTSGVTVATLSPVGALAANAPMKVLLGWSPTGVVLAHSAGGLARATVARPPGLYRGLLGHAAADASRPMNGELLADFYPFFPSDAEARALVAI
jgi:hypothetical protein